MTFSLPGIQVLLWLLWTTDTGVPKTLTLANSIGRIRNSCGEKSFICTTERLVRSLAEPDPEILEAAQESPATGHLTHDYRAASPECDAAIAKPLIHLTHRDFTLMSWDFSKLRAIDTQQSYTILQTVDHR